MKRQHVMEMNFVVQRFMGLPKEERRRIYDAFNGGGDGAEIDATLDILNLLTCPPEEELTEYANSVLGLKVTGYIICPDTDDMLKRAIWFNSYFNKNLKLDGEGVLIAPMPMEEIPDP